ncbi:MAG: Fic family protein [Bacteriovoracaceae bacterium]
MTALLDARILKRLTSSLAELNRHRPLKASTLKKLREQFTVEMTYHSNAIEGNRLTLKETLLVLREGVTIKGKNLQEHLEAKNHEEAMNFLFEVVDSKKRLTLSHQLIRQLHQLVVKDTEASIAGTYRNTDVQILGSKHRPPPGYQVQEQMTKFFEWMAESKSNYHPVEFAALAHHRFVAIHPFEDGNGRTGRLLMNLLLMRNDYPIAIIQKNDRTKYYNALDDADAGDMLAIVRIVAQAVERTLSIYIKAIVKSSSQSELLLLSELADKTEFSAKHLNLLARKGMLKAQKEGRNWYSSLKAVEDYKKSRLRKRDS